MTGQSDPFRHHPELRGRIVDPDLSFFRGFEPAAHDARMRALGFPDDWRYSDAEREARRRSLLAGRGRQPLWVFAYGSLMEDPGFHFSDVRHGRIAGYARRFCLKDTFGWRGSAAAPGLMAALDKGFGCEGLVFCIAPEAVETES